MAVAKELDKAGVVTEIMTARTREVVALVGEVVELVKR